jgi:hypothetical protein
MFAFDIAFYFAVSTSCPFLVVTELFYGVGGGNVSQLLCLEYLSLFFMAYFTMSISQSMQDGIGKFLNCYCCNCHSERRWGEAKVTLPQAYCISLPCDTAL